MRTSFSATALDRISEMRANGVTLAILAKQYQTTRCVMTRIIQELNPVPIIRATLDCCRDVVGKELFCGAPVARGSFCAAHAEKYYLPKKQKLED